MELNDQVSIRESQRGVLGSQSLSVVKMGNIVAFNDDRSKALVSISATSVSTSRPGNVNRRWIDVANLQPTADRFDGRKVVQVDPNKRGISTLLR